MSGVGISCIYILDLKGRVLITRSYRGDLSTEIYDNYNQKILEFDENTIKPIFLDNDGNSFFHIRFSNLIFIAVAKENVNAMVVFAFLYKLIEVLKSYFNELEEESVRDNFVVIYELLDEMCDNGYPQTTEVKVLSEFIKTESHELKSDKKKNDLQITQTLSNVVSWRPEGIKYKKNEIFLDVVEKVNMLINPNSNVIKQEVLGEIKCKSYLSGMPELKLGLNDKALFEIQGKQQQGGKTVDLQDLKFHQCVRLSKFENERAITFIPPDGEFDLISYRLDISIRPLFMVEVAIEEKSTKVSFYVKAKTNFKEKCVASNVEIFIPVPNDAQNPVFKPGTGTVKYVPDRDMMQWSVRTFPGSKELFMNGTFSLPSVRGADSESYKRIPIQMEFEIPYFTVSGIQVRYLKIEDKSGYQGLPWVRYITQNGDYQIRTGV